MAGRLLGRPWTILILAVLGVKPRRFTEIVGELPGISTNLLSERLRVLDHAGVIERYDDGDVSCYRLTDAGQLLVPILVALEAWGTDIGSESK